MSNTTRNDALQLAQTIEHLAKDVQNKLTNDGDFLAATNELVRNNLTLVFTLGEYCASLENKTVAATPMSNPNNTQVRYHNVRDSHGRFARKV